MVQPKGLSDLERECLEIFYMLRHYLEHPMSNKEFIDFGGLIKRAITKLNNKKFGCFTGLHAGKCDCPWIR